MLAYLMRSAQLKKSLLLTLGALIAGVIVATITLVNAGLHDDLGHADVALVLGNKIEADGTPSTRLRVRLDRTAELYRAGYFPVVIASGGVGKEGFDEAKVMREYLVAHAVPTECIIVDSAGDTSYLSAQNAAALARARGFKSILVVSQYFHIPRSRLALRRFGFLRVYSSHARFFEVRDLISAPRELLGYVSYYCRSYPAVDHTDTQREH